MNGSMLPQYMTPTHRKSADTARTLERFGAARPVSTFHPVSNVK